MIETEPKEQTTQLEESLEPPRTSTQQIQREITRTNKQPGRHQTTISAFRRDRTTLPSYHPGMTRKSS